MNLIVDLGNTSAKFALFEKGRMQKSQVYVSPELSGLHEFCGSCEINAAILSSVVDIPAWYRAFVSGLDQQIELDSNTPLPIINAYQTPETLGNDRLACAVAGFYLRPEHPVLIIDAGTCIKYDLVVPPGRYIGGAISPGLHMRLKAMHTFTARLPLVELSDYRGLAGTDTRESMLSGAVNGSVEEIRGVIRRYRQQYKGLKTILTGGDTAFFAGRLKSRIFAEPHLLMVGLNKILEHNAKNT